MGKVYGRIGDFTVTGVKEEVFDADDSSKSLGFVEKVRIDATACQIEEDSKGKLQNVRQGAVQFKLSLLAYRSMSETDFEAKLVEKGRKVLPDLAADAEFVVLGGA